MAKNSNLRKAKKTKDDEYYTTYGDISAEIKKDFYGEFFRDKVIYCNCDDSEKSNFFKFFFNRYEHFGWKRLICTSYNKNGKGTIRIIDGDKNKNGILDTDEYKDVTLNGNGDFRSEECLEYLKQADVVVTNPPFSLFREYVKQLMDYGKKFLIIGPHSAVTYKEIFPYIKNGELWFGRMVTHKEDGKSTIKGNSMSFERYVGGTKDVGAWWFTNIEEVRKNDFFVPKHRKSYKMYSNEYPKYDNYDAIEVSNWDNIPLDYDGIMGVPYTGLKYFCPKQFEIIGGFNGYKESDEANGLLCGTLTEYIDKNGKVKTWTGPTINKKTCYYRLLIRKRTA